MKKKYLIFAKEEIFNIFNLSKLKIKLENATAEQINESREFSILISLLLSISLIYFLIQIYSVTDGDFVFYVQNNQTDFIKYWLYFFACLTILQFNIRKFIYIRSTYKLEIEKVLNQIKEEMRKKEEFANSIKKETSFADIFLTLFLFIFYLAAFLIVLFLIITIVKWFWALAPTPN